MASGDGIHGGIISQRCESGITIITSNLLFDKAGTTTKKFNPAESPWNKGKLSGAKPPLRPKLVWAIGTRLQILGRTRDLAMFNLAIDRKLRDCDLVRLTGTFDRAANGLKFLINRFDSDHGSLNPEVLSPAGVEDVTVSDGGPRRRC
jgi:hypothetical protein